MILDLDISIIFLIIIPILVVFLGYYIYSFYVSYSQKQIIINVLSKSTSDILNEKKQISIDEHKVGFLEKKLTYAGFIYPSAKYIFTFISVGFGLLAGTFINIVMGSPIIYVVSSVIFSLFPYLVLLKIIAAREEEFGFGLKSIIDKVTSMMQSGVGFEQAFKKSIQTTKSKFAKDVFHIYIKEKEIIGEDKAFEKMFKLVESKELRIFYLVISIGRSSGGKFSNTLQTLRKTLHDQGTIKQEITSSTKEIKVGTYLILAITVGIYFMMNSVFNGALNKHFFGSDSGKMQIFFIAIWVAFGIFVNNMMTKIKG